MTRALAAAVASARLCALPPSQAEIALVGNEGVVGVSIFLGGESTPSRAFVRSAGGVQAALVSDERRIQPCTGTAAAAALRAGPDYADGADRRVQPAPFAGPAAVPLAAAEPGSSAGQRTRDDAGTDRQHVRRAARRRNRRRALKLQAAGCIRYSRGRITVLDRPALEQRTCECYEFVKKEYERLLPNRVAR